MKITAVRKNVLKALPSNKDTKMALKVLSKDTELARLLNASLSFSISAGQLLIVTTPYLLGSQFAVIKDEDLRWVLGKMGADIAVLSKSLDVRLPSASKRVRLNETRAKAILDMHECATALNEVAAQFLTEVPTHTITRTVVLPKQGGKKESREVVAINRAEFDKQREGRLNRMHTLLAMAVQTYWRLVFDIYHEGPEKILDEHFSMLESVHGKEFFAAKAKVQETVAA